MSIELFSKIWFCAIALQKRAITERSLKILSGSIVSISLPSVRRYLARSRARARPAVSINLLTSLSVVVVNCSDSIILEGTP